MTAQCVVTAIFSDGAFTMSNAATGGGTQTLTFARPNALYFLRVLDTDIGAGPGKAIIDTVIAKNVNRRGLSIGDRSYPVTQSTVLECRSIDITPRATTALDSGWQLLHLEAPVSGRSKLGGKAHVRFNATYGNDCLYGPAGSQVDLGLVDHGEATANGSSVVGRTVQFAGGGVIGEIRLVQPGSSGSSTAITLSGSNLRCGPITGDAASAISVALLDVTGLTDFELGPVFSTNFRASPAVMVNGATRGLLKIGKLLGDNINGWGMRFQNNTDVTVQGGFISDFAIGTTGAANNNTRCTFIDVKCSSNTIETDLANGQATLVGSCLNATL
jgi:hypothetical protein